MNAPSNQQRRALRAAIAAHPGWRAYRAATGRGDTSTLSGAACLAVCADLGIDPAAILFGSPAAPAPVAAPAAAPVAAPVAPAGLFTPTTKEPAPMPATPDLAAALATIAAAINNPAPAVDLGPVVASVDALGERVAALESAKPALLVVDPNGAPLGDALPGARHPQLDTLLRAVSARDVSGARLNVWLAGPAGSGKTHAAKQVAAALGLTFGFHGAMTYTHELLGFVDAGGTYHATQFVRLFESGGVCLLDELDSGTSEALLALNAALANGQMSLPDGRIITRHADFVCVGAANTWGTGATAEYVGRTKLDAAFLSRFPVKLAWAYDAELEQSICGNAVWAREVQTARDAARAAGLKVVIDPRHSIAGAALLAAGMDRATVATLTYLAGLTPEQAAMIRKAVSK